LCRRKCKWASETKIVQKVEEENETCFVIGIDGANVIPLTTHHED